MIRFFQREMLEEWLQQRIICAVNGRHDENFALSRTVPQCEWPRHYGIAQVTRIATRGNSTMIRFGNNRKKGPITAPASGRAGIALVNF